MSEIITQLTPEQTELIPIYGKKWLKIALSCQPLDREKAAEAVKNAYAAMGLSPPEMVFVRGPLAALRTIMQHKWRQLEKAGEGELLREKSSKKGENFAAEVGKLMTLELGEELDEQLWEVLSLQFCDDLIGQVQPWVLETIERETNYRQLLNQIDRLGIYLINLLIEERPRELEKMLVNLEENRDFSYLVTASLKNGFLGPVEPCISTPKLVAVTIWSDFLISVLGCQYDRNKWEILRCLATDCSWFFPFKNICFMCDRPLIFSADNQQRLHAEGGPTVEFADGFEVYAYQGVILPETYGKRHPSKWRCEWLLSETNAELRRVLLQGIGYDRICQELQCKTIDSWQEYDLLEIYSEVDIEPIYILKMTCPSTDKIHALRVPPNIQSARAAIQWVNWGIDPPEFKVQT